MIGISLHIQHILTIERSHIFVHVTSKDSEFQRNMLCLFIANNGLRREVVVRFVDVGGIVDHC